MLFSNVIPDRDRGSTANFLRNHKLSILKSVRTATFLVKPPLVQSNLQDYIDLMIKKIFLIIVAVVIIFVLSMLYLIYVGRNTINEISDSGMLVTNETKVSFPKGIPPYADSKLKIASPFLSTYTYTATDTPDNVLKFYSNYFNENGYKITIKDESYKGEKGQIILYKLTARKNEKGYLIETWNNGIDPTHIIYNNNLAPQEISAQSPRAEAIAK